MLQRLLVHDLCRCAFVSTILYIAQHRLGCSSGSVLYPPATQVVGVERRRRRTKVSRRQSGGVFTTTHLRMPVTMTTAVTMRSCRRLWSGAPGTTPHHLPAHSRRPTTQTSPMWHQQTTATGPAQWTAFLPVGESREQARRYGNGVSATHKQPPPSARLREGTAAAVVCPTRNFVRLGCTGLVSSCRGQAQAGGEADEANAE